MRLYVAGPMTGYPDFNYPEFFRVSGELALAGYETLNPAYLGVRVDMTYQDYIRAGLRLLLKADGVALLDGWERSNGASLEVQVAEAIGLEALPWLDWRQTRR